MKVYNNSTVSKNTFSMGKKKYRIKSKFRFITSIIVIMGIFMGTVGMITGINISTALTKPEYKEIQIDSGDTLWKIAQEYKNKDTDTRKAVYELCKTNNIEASDLYPGMIISVPENL